VSIADVSSLTVALSNSQLPLIGDLNGDGKVTNADVQGLVNLLADAAASGGQLSTVPEPPAAALAAVGGAILLGATGRKRCAAARLPR
jgi:hypothetical protein